MKLISFYFFIIIISFKSFSQDVGRDLDMRNNPYIETTVKFKDSTIKKGFLKLESPTNLKFKDSINQKKGYKVDYKQVSSIINFVNNQHRVYNYRKTTRNKFLSFVEIITYSKNKKIEVSIY